MEWGGIVLQDAIRSRSNYTLRLYLMKKEQRRIGVQNPVWVFVLFLAFILSGCGQLSTVQSSMVPSKPIVTKVAHPRAVATPPSDMPLPPAPLANPVRLLVPAIGINAAIESLGILTNGSMATPTLHPWDDTGWYNMGPHPGEKGSAVIDGHLDRPGGYPAIFWNLRNLRPGDTVTIVDAAGKKLTFLVNRVVAYQPLAAPLQDIFGNENGTFLNLITCAGDWIPSQHQTTLRLVVYTTLVG